MEGLGPVAPKQEGVSVILYGEVLNPGDPGYAEYKTLRDYLGKGEKRMTTRAKAGETLMKNLKAREARAKGMLVQIAQKRQEARDKQTGKTRAVGAVRAWLGRLDTAELREEAELRGFMWEGFDSIDQAIDCVVTTIFRGPGPILAGQAYVNGAEPGEGAMEQMELPLDEPGRA